MLLLLAALATGDAAAQREPATHAPDRDGSSSLEGVSIPQISGAAFQAQERLEIKTVLADGTTVERQASVGIARDSQGRVYRERRRIIPVNEEGKEAPLEAILLLDAQQGTETECLVTQRVCTIRALRTTTQQRAISHDGKIQLERATVGTESMEGVTVEHIRERRTIAAGAYGNDRAITSTVEYWYAPQLEIDLQILRTSPQGRSQRLRVTDLNLSEPELQLFKPPDGFRVIDGRRAADQVAAQ